MTNTADHYLDMIASHTARIKEMQDEIAGFVAVARAEGASWGQIAPQLQTTRQGAQQRYGG